MDPVMNPYAPGAGTQPPELAGRDRLREDVRIALARIRAGRVAKSVMLVGLRGVGKTVLLDRLRNDAEASGVYTVRAETPENRSLPALLAPSCGWFCCGSAGRRRRRILRSADYGRWPDWPRRSR